MKEATTFISDLAITEKGVKVVKNLTDQAYGNMNLQRTQIYKIIKDVKV
jgi:hypothetical protein